MLRPKIRTVGMIVLLVFLMVGCSENDSTPNLRVSSEDNTSVTFSYFSFSQGKQDTLASETTIGKKLKEQTAVDWEMEYLVGDSASKAGVLIASRDYPDVISSSGEMSKLLDAGAYIPLDDLIEEYGPNIKRVYGSYFEKMRNPSDGKIYALPYTANQGEHSLNPNINGGAFWIQRSVLKEFNYPEITTLDEYFDLIQSYKKKNPTKDSEETIGFVFLAGVAHNFFTLQNPAMHLAGYPNDGNVMVDMETHEAKLVAGSQAQKRWIHKLNEINAKGLLDPESFTMNKDQYLDKLTSGRVLGFFNYGWQIGDVTKKLLAAGIDEKRYAPLPIVFEKGIMDQYINPPAFVSNYATGITIKAKDPVRIIKYFDNLLKEENQILVQWGIKDETYSIDEKGRFYFANEIQRKFHDDLELRRKYGFTYFGADWPRYGTESTLSSGNAYSPSNQLEAARSLYTEGDKKFLEAYDIQTFSEMFNSPKERPWFPTWSITLEQGSSAQVFIKKSDDLQRQYLPELILSSPSNFNKLWETYIDELSKLDQKGYEETISNIVKDRIAGKW